MALTETLPTLESIWLQEPDGKYGELDEKIVESSWADDDLFGSSGVERSWEYLDSSGEVVYTSSRPLLGFPEFLKKFGKGYEAISSNAVALLEKINLNELNETSPDVTVTFSHQFGFEISFLLKGDTLPISISPAEINASGAGIVEIKVEERQDLKEWMEEKERRRVAANAAYAAAMEKRRRAVEEAEAPLNEFFEVLEALGYAPSAYDVVGKMDNGKIEVWLRDFVRNKDIPFKQGNRTPAELAKVVFTEFQARTKPRLLSTGKPAPIKRKRR